MTPFWFKNKRMYVRDHLELPEKKRLKTESGALTVNVLIVGSGEAHRNMLNHERFNGLGDMEERLECIDPELRTYVLRERLWTYREFDTALKTPILKRSSRC